MKKLNALIAGALGLLVPVLLLAQEEVPPAFDPHTGNLSEGIVAAIVGIFASGAAWFKIIDGLKNLIPWFRDNAMAMKIVNFAGNFLTLGASCFVLGQVHNAFDAAKCLFMAVTASLISAGFYEGKRVSDLARASASPATFARIEEKREEGK